jgi:putative hydrolase of the HAD superfamily
VTPPIPPGIRAVVFDAVGTLIHPEPAAAAVYAEAGRLFGSRLDPATVAARFAAAFGRQERVDYAAGLRTDEGRELARWRAIVAEVLDDVTDPTAAFSHLYEHFARPDAWRTEPGAAAAVAELAARGYRVGIASNFDHRLAGVLAPGELRGLPVVISAAVGWRKPAAAFFAAVCRTFGLEAREVLYVGDDLANDYEGARAAGLSAVLFDPRGRAPAGIPRVTRPGELLDLGRESAAAERRK